MAASKHHATNDGRRYSIANRDAIEIVTENLRLSRRNSLPQKKRNGRPTNLDAPLYFQARDRLVRVHQLLQRQNTASKRRVSFISLSCSI